MRLRTRVLSFMLAGSMMLSATPVSAFAGTPVLGGGTVSPTALSETNSTDGVYSSRVDGSHELRCTGGIFTDTQNTTYNDAIYVVNQNSAPAAKLKFTPPDGHSIVAWRIDMDTAWGYNDATNPKVQMLLKAANLKCSADNTELTFTCPGSITYGGETYPAFVADASLTPVLNITAADLLFEKGTIVLGNELSSGSGITATLVYYSVTDGVKGSEAMTTRPTKPGQYQIAVRLSVDGASATDKYANRVKCGNVYYQVDPSQELTSEKWRYRVVSSSVNLTVDENGEPVVPSGTAGVSYADGVLTIYPRFVVHFGVNDIVNCDIVNEGKLDGGIFTGTVTNKGVIESGMFVNKPENANSVKFSFTSGAAFCGQKDPSGTTSLYIVCTGSGSHPQLSASYSNPSRTAAGWLVAVTSPSFKGTNYGSMMTDNWTLVSSISTALSEQLYDAVAVYTPVAYMDSSDLSIDPTGKVNISIPEVEATGVTYTNKATNETFTSYPTVAGDYVAKVSLKCKRNWDSLTSQSPVIPASALLADDGVAALSEEQENLIYRIALKGDLYYFVPKTLDVNVTVEQSAPASSVVTLTVDENGAPVIPENAKGVRYENNTLIIDEHTTARFAQGSTVKCDIVNNGTLDGGLFTGTVTNHGVIESGLFVNKPENADSAKFSFTSGATFCGLKDSSGITSLYVVRTENGQNLHLTASYSNPNRDPFGWVQAIDIPNTTESAYLLYKNPNLNPWTVDVWADSALSKEQTDVATTFTPVACMKSSDLSIDSTGKVDISIPEVEATGVTYTNKATNETFTSYPTVAGDYVAKVSLKCKRNWDSLTSQSPVIPASALLADDGVAALSEEQENLIYRIALKGDLYYFVPKTLDVNVTVEQSAPASSVVTLTVDENGAPVIPENAKGVRYENNTLTIDEHTTAQFAQGSTVKCDIVNNGTLDGGLFTGTVTGSGSIARGLFLHDPKAASPTMMLSVPENASLNGITAPDATGLTTLYAINTLDGKDNMLLFIGDYIGTDSHDFYGWDLVYSFGGEEKNSDVEKNYIGHTHFEQPMYGPIPNGQNGVKCIFLPVLEMNASDLTITADKTESKITGAVIYSVQYVDASDPNAAPSSAYPTKAGKYKAIVTLTCPGDSTYSKARVARIGNLCYHVPETLEVEVTVELPTVPPTDGDGNVTFEGTDEVKGDGWTAKKDETTGETTVTITDSKNLNNTTLNCDKITIGSEGTSTTVSNITTNADVTVASGSAIEGGTFSGKVISAGEIKGGTFEKDVTTTGTITDGAFKGNVSGEGTITGGTFSGSVSGGTIEGGTFRGDIGSEVKINGGTFTGNVDSTNINGGVFAGEIPDTVTSTKVTATGGASINNIQKNEGTNQETAVQVVGEQQLSLAYTPDTGRTFYGWKETAGGDSTLNTNSSITIHENDETERTFTPVVVMNEKDLTAAGESKITGVTVTSLLYYPVNDAGEITGEGSAERPTEDGSYILVAMLELSSQEPSENGIALFAAENTDLSRVVEQDGIGYYVPESLTVERITNGEDVPSDTGSGDSGAGGAAVAVIGGAAIGGAAYLIGTQVYLTSILPEGASIPTNRQQLADLLWTAAGKPQPASTALFTDISAEAADSQKAARWCVEQGLLKDTGSTFKPDKHTFRPQVIKAWNDLQAKLNPQK